MAHRNIRWAARAVVAAVALASSGCEEPCDKLYERPRLEGTLATAVSDIEYTDGHAFIDFTHKRDVDPVEDGCIGAVSLDLSTLEGECLLQLELSAREGEPALALDRAVLIADSDCPGWLDAVEADYEWDGGGEGASLSIPTEAPDNTERACVETPALEPVGRITLKAPGEDDLEIDLSDLTIQGGAVWSNGREELGCPAL